MLELLRGLGFGSIGDLVTALRSLFASAMVPGKLLDVSIASGATSGTARHALGRVAKGAAVVGSSAAGAFTVDLVTSSTDSVTVRASSAVGSTVTVRLWVF
jgi:NADPH-dependent curcumin reductase CurA